MTSRVCVIVPALNEAGNVAKLVGEVRAALPEAAILVVDNGSTDGTGDEASAAGAQVVREPRRGYGYACAAGVAVARDADILVFLDGDNSFTPAELPRLLAPLLSGEADLVLGSRVRGGMPSGAMPPHQQFGNRLVAAMMRRLYRVPLTDVGPYRAIRRPLLELLDMREMTYGWPTEMIVKAARRHARLVEVPVSYRSRYAGASKVGGTVRGTVLAARAMLGVILRYAWSRD